MEIVWSRVGKRPLKRGERLLPAWRKLPSACRPQGKTRAAGVGAWVRTGLGEERVGTRGGCPAERATEALPALRALPSLTTCPVLTTTVRSNHFGRQSLF